MTRMEFGLPEPARRELRELSTTTGLSDFPRNLCCLIQETHELGTEAEFLAPRQ